ncbi:four-helix bundle copper-binding protein [Candidatus Berkiella aquae]|uniref:Four-helix bundle copper-binding protein n=1 Tax=Candidatus Berkiella aquae TaxID=295108 RepID=A0A0Q9YF31_9GAMM|nr:four-helix bundle copper-binding protein [Candidatus Berkiella aquae]MCS5712895.1 four-helix bundle copper-binding protein [Candidatus Berkiella aquae]
MPHQVSSEIRSCIDNCLECHTKCTETINHCLKKGNEHSDPKHINILLDCAQICQTSADFMLRTSNLHPKTCDVCAQACKNCAEDCEKIGKDDDLMKECAKICWECAESCKKMAKH